MFFFARMLLIPIQWPPELCAHRAKKMPHTNTRNNNRRKSTNNGTSSWRPAEVEQKNTRRHKTKQHQVVFHPGLTLLPFPHSLSLCLGLCYRQSIFKAETERYSQIQPMTVAPMSVDSILLLTCVSLSLRATDGIFLLESLLSSHPVGLAHWKL